MVLWCQIHDAKRLRFDSELNRLVWWEKLVNIGSQMSHQFMGVWIARQTLYRHVGSPGTELEFAL